MTVQDICWLPVRERVAESCQLAMWWLPTQTFEAMKVVDAWGFRLITMKGFTWDKTYPKQTDKSAMGMGHLIRANREDCLFAVKGKRAPQQDASIIQHYPSPRHEHSRKPDCVREMLVRLLGNLPRIELFARKSSHGFDVWGNKCDSPTVSLSPARVTDVYS
ncbi:MT-A70 family protein [Escherichia coli P0301867.5]|nr:MT-A70 family protein [Escherichia coli P0301867.5]